MSGGTFNYRDRQLGDLIEELRTEPPNGQDWDGNARSWADYYGEHDRPLARELVAEMLAVTLDAMHELDWHYAQDSHIDDDEAFVARYTRVMGEVTVKHLVAMVERLDEQTVDAG